MQEITIEIDAQRAGRANGFIGGLTVERYAFTGADLPAGTRLAILTRAGCLIAAAEIADGNAAEVDTNTQEVADLLRYQPLGACENVYITLGDADNILAIIPATMRKNWLDDEATHPPVPANRYPTKAELDQWLARFDENAAATAAAQSAAEAASTSARASATAAEQSARAAGDSAVDAEDSATDAEGSKRAAEVAQGKAEAAQSAAENARDNAQEALQSADQHARNAAASEQAALTAKQSAETAQGQAKASETAAKASETAAKRSETASRASEQAAKASEQAAGESATAAAASANVAKASETAAASSATAAEAAKAGAEAAKAAAETAKAGAEAAKAAAASSATAAANSADAAAKSATDLADAVATAESLDGRLSAIEPSALRAKDVVISTDGNNIYNDGAFSYNPAIETFYNTGTIQTGAYFLACCTGLKWVYASHWDKIGSNAFRDCYSLTEVKGSVWRVANMMNDKSEIGAYAFRNCTNLEKMPPVSNEIKTLESGHWAGVRIINVGAFYNCRKLPAQFVKDIISSPALWSIKNDAFKYCCLDSGGIDELVLGKNIVFNSWGAFSGSGVKRVDCSQMVKDPLFNAQFQSSLLEEFILPQRQFSYYNAFGELRYLRYVKMPPEEPVVLIGNNLFYKDNSFSKVDEVTVEFPITRAEAEAWTKYQHTVLDSFPLEKTVFNFTDEQGVTYDA